MPPLDRTPLPCAGNAPGPAACLLENHARPARRASGPASDEASFASTSGSCPAGQPLGADHRRERRRRDGQGRGPGGVFQRRNFHNYARPVTNYHRRTLLATPNGVRRGTGPALAPPCPSGTYRSSSAARCSPSRSTKAAASHRAGSSPGQRGSFAGTSFITVDQLGLLQYGSAVVNISADPLFPGGLGTFGWDDEGTPAERFPIVQNGRFVNYLTSRETPGGWPITTPIFCRLPPLPFSNGTMRATVGVMCPCAHDHVSLEPGD